MAAKTKPEDTKPEPDGSGTYVCVWPDDVFVTGVDGIIIGPGPTPVPAASIDAVKKAAADNDVKIRKV